MSTIPDIAIGAIAAALIAGLVSLLGLIISKEQKTSEFRQAWIDALRTELSATIAHANAIHGANAANLGTLTELWKDVRDDYVGINEATASIRLRLNPKEPSAQAVLARIEELEAHLAPGQRIYYEQINALEKKLVTEAQVLLKDEWNRVRAGETTYKIARVAALAVSAACVIALVAVAVAKVVGV